MEEANGTPVPAKKKRFVPPFLFGGAVVGLGILALAIIGMVEQRWLATVPWHGAIRTLDYTIEDPAAITVWSWELTPEQSLGNSAIASAVQQDLMDKIKTNKVAPERLKEESPVVAMSSTEMLDEALIPRARLVMLDRDASFFEEVLVSGRVPEAGEPEILAGPLLADRPLEIGGTTYTVVGRLHPNVSGFVKAYVMPADARLRAALDAVYPSATGSVHLAGAGNVAALVPEVSLGDLDRIPVIYGGEAVTRTDIAWAVWASLFAVAFGSVQLFMTLLSYLAAKNLGPLNVLFGEIERRSSLLWLMNAVLFGGFFGAMAFGIRDVEMNYLFTEFASHQFTKGGLKYVGEAYMSGDIPRAAHATFWNNYVVQTVLYGALPSQVALGIGAVKTLASFVVVGFAMAPVWSGTATGMTYHAITLGLELPPYVLAAFGMVVWALAAFNFLWSPVRVWYLGDKAKDVPVIADAARQLPRALGVMAGTLVLSGIVLYLAAWYEATTLILFR